LLHGFFPRFLIALLVTGLVAGGSIVAVNTFIDRKLGEIKKVKLETAPPPPEGANFLLIGSDSRADVTTELEEEAFGDPNDPEVAGQRSDTMMVIHVEPDQQRTFVVSFPRDLLVDTDGDGDREQINTAFSDGGPQQVIDTLERNFGIPIQHYVEIGLLAFVDIVNAIGSVPVYFPAPQRDEVTGFSIGIYGAGCYDLDGEGALQYVRARNMEQYDEETGDYELIDVQSDPNRIQRQQAFIRRLAALAVDKGLSNPLTAYRIADDITQHLVVDDGLTTRSMFDLLAAFRDVDPNDPTSLEMVTIPWQPFEPDPNRLVVDEAAAEPVLQRLRDFGGLAAPTEVTPAEVRVRVLNGSDIDGAADETAADLQAEGFQIANIGNGGPATATQVLYASGLEGKASLVQSYLNGVGMLHEDPSIVDADVVVLIGDDFRGVRKPGGGAGTALGAVRLTSSVRPAQEVPVPDIDGVPAEPVAC
jgi:LCP family protein required for cell wall assembly